MKEILKRIKKDTEACLNPNTIEELKEKLCIVEDSISDLYEELFDRQGGFVTLLNLNVLKVLGKQIKIIERTMPNGSRTQYNKRDFFQKVAFHLENFRNSIINDYRSALKGSVVLEEHLEREEKHTNSIKNALLTSDYDFDNNEYIDTISTDRFKEIVDEAYGKTLSFFEGSFEGSVDKELSKQSLVIFLNKSYDKVIRLNKTINVLSVKIERLEEKGVPENKEIPFELEDGSIEYYNPVEDYIYNLVQLSNEKHNNIYLKDKLEVFIDRAFSSFDFLSNTVFAGARLKKSVFGNFNYDLLKSLYLEMKPYLRSEVREHHFIEVFILNSEPPEIKIDLVKGKSEDFGRIISSLHEQFTAEFSDPNTYNNWWIDRFTFKGVDKDLQGIRRMKSSERSPKYPQVIESIKAVFPNS